MNSVRTRDRKACQSKIRHETEQEAETHARALSAARPITYHAYRCPVDACGGWHVGRSLAPKPPSPGRKARQQKGIRYWRWRLCSTKAAYASDEEARQFSDYHNSYNAFPVVPVRCWFCGAHHIIGVEALARAVEFINSRKGDA